MLIHERLHIILCDLFILKTFYLFPFIAYEYNRHSVLVSVKSRFTADHKRIFIQPLLYYCGRNSNFPWESRGTRAFNGRKQIDDNQSSY